MKLLFVDEELLPQIAPDGTPDYMSYYVNALKKSGISFDVAVRIDDAMQILEKHAKQYDVVSIDIIMPSGSRFSSDETMHGARSGLRFLDWMIKCRIAIPVIIFSNVNPIILRRELPEDFGPVRLIDVVHKPTTSPFTFIKLLENSGARK